MTWIRWETRAPGHEVVGAIAEELGVRKAEALGLYNAACCGFGEFRRDGRADEVTDTTLEQWANWEGRRGKFAAVFRERCVERRTDQRDPSGVVKGWWRQAKLLERQEFDAMKRKKPTKNPRKTPKKPSGVNKGNSEGFGENPQKTPNDSVGYVYGTTSTVYESSSVLGEERRASQSGYAPEGATPPISGEPGTDIISAQEFQRRKAEAKAKLAEAFGVGGAAQ